MNTNSNSNSSVSNGGRKKKSGRKTRDERNGIGFCVVLTVIIWARFLCWCWCVFCICYALMSLMNSYHLIASIRCLYLMLSHSLPIVSFESLILCLPFCLQFSLSEKRLPSILIFRFSNWRKVDCVLLS